MHAVVRTPLPGLFRCLKCGHAWPFLFDAIGHVVKHQFNVRLK